MDATLILDALIAVFLLITIGYVVILNKKLGAFRDAKSEMETLIGQFSESADRAGNGIQSLKEELRRSGAALQNKIEAARGTVDDLGFLIERGNNLAERLDGGVGAARAKTGAVVGRPQAPANRTPSLLAAAAGTETKPVRGKTAPPRDAIGNTPGNAPGNAPGDAMGDAADEAVDDAGPAEAGAPDLSAAESELLKALQGMR